MYRGNDTPHHRTGTKHKAYPTYDFACPIVDSLEGVTHALRTTEYNDRDEQYHWIQAALDLAHRTQIRAFGKMNFVHTCLSKRKLAWFVENKLVEGWFDPRFPTIQGIMRRGVTIEGLKSFILSQGASRRIITMEWDKFWAENKQVLETTAARYMGVMTPGEVTLTLTNVAAEITAHSTPIMPQFPDKGSRVIRRFNKVFIDHADALVMSVGEQVTLLRWGNVTIKSIEKSADGTRVVSMTAENNPESTDFKKTKKYTWLAATVRLTPQTLFLFEPPYFLPSLLFFCSAGGILPLLPPPLRQMSHTWSPAPVGSFSPSAAPKARWDRSSPPHLLPFPLSLLSLGCS
jgi:glutamyl/glutaminyl-tRNA synthetase